jgi:hypothetical protein
MLNSGRTFCQFQLAPLHLGEVSTRDVSTDTRTLVEVVSGQGLVTVSGNLVSGLGAGVGEVRLKAGGDNETSTRPSLNLLLFLLLLLLLLLLLRFLLFLFLLLL